MLRRGVECKVCLDVTAVTLNAHASDATISITERVDSILGYANILMFKLNTSI